MKCRNLKHKVSIDKSKGYNGVYLTKNSIYCDSYSYYRSPNEKDEYNTHFTIFPTDKGNGEFKKFHISLNFSKTGISNGKIFYVKGVCTGIDDKNLTKEEKVKFEKIFKEKKEIFNEIAQQFWNKVQEVGKSYVRFNNDTKEYAYKKHIQQIKKKVEDELLSREGVTAVDIDYKVKGGVKSNELAIIVFVKNKHEVPSKLEIPKTIQGIKTDVWEGDFSAYVHTQKANPQTIKEVLVDPIANPIIGGVSVGPFDRDIYGTLGLVLDTDFGIKMLISSTHVLASGPHTKQGDPMSQPALPLGGHYPESLAGSYYMGFIGQPHNIDASLATIPIRNAESKTIQGLGNTRGHDVTFPGDDVAKYGRTTQFTSGKVVSDTFTCVINYQNFGPMTYYNQLRIQSNNPYNPFSQPGDSGSMIVNEDMEVVGMLMGGGQSNSGQYHTIANPIGDIIRTFEANGIRFI
ncbi:hypothetical protein [Flavivirga spongiicola]|uniref:S1 family peptidase n=1 Tax=Flavivirga spongiicola TaxID=421621 RepID=A0ABU7XRH2_9FLAO|nr:hypothetical protein [Flavivirga sp. MEBiC05379]MDO5978357.1 hypothetical protein [Flavivirga sp. MEBiC05379]